LACNLLDQDRLIEAQDALDLLKDNAYLDFTGENGREMRSSEQSDREQIWKDKLYQSSVDLLNAHSALQLELTDWKIADDQLPEKRRNLQTAAEKMNL